MRVVLYGNFAVDYCSEVHHARSIEALGHEVIRLQETNVTANEVLRESLKSDMLVWVHSHGFVNQGMPMRDVLVILKDQNVPTVAYHLDLYMGLERWREYEASPYMQVEHFFTVDKQMADWFNKNTQVKGHYLPAGVFHEECYIAESSTNQNDVIFVGSKGYHPEHSYRPKLIDWLKATYGSQFKHYGGDGLGVVRGERLNQLYADTKVVVGDSLCINFDYPNYWSDRVFETMGRGGFIIHPYIKGMEEYFEDGKHLVFYEFGDFDGLKEKINFYISHPEEREKIRKAGHEHVKKNHTYEDRWAEIIREVKNAR